MSTGSKAADKTVQRLIRRSAQRVFAAGDLEFTEDCLSTLVGTMSSLGEYLTLERFADREAYHVRIKQYSRVGGVVVDWDRSAGPNGQIKRVSLKNPGQCAEILGSRLPWVVAGEALSSLRAVHSADLPSIDGIETAWRAGKTAGSVRPEQASLFIDALRLIAETHNARACQADLMLRRVSTRLFGDSKRAEALVSALSYLLGESKDDSVALFAGLGLVKHPQPILVSGGGELALRAGGRNIQLVKPYVGVRPDSLEGISTVGVRIVLSIENLASFNEAAEANHDDSLLIVYTAGNPTPAWLRAYRRLLVDSNAEIALHWGDVDVGGFRIASRIAKVAAEEGLVLQGWRMESFADDTVGRAAPELQVTEVLKRCGDLGWEQEAIAMKRHRTFLEQELLPWEAPRV